MTPQPKINTVIVKLASRCNLNCGYCYLYNHEDTTYLKRPALMSEEVFAAIVEAMARHCDRNAPHSMSLLLHGGEPLLIGQERFTRLVERARATLGERLRRISVQTNAVLTDRNWAETLAALGIDVSVSLDGPAALHDQLRVDHHGEGSYHRVIKGLQSLMEAGIHPNVLCVINPRTSGIEVYRHFLRLGLKRFDFLFPDITHESKPLIYGNVGANAVARYLIPIFDEWLAADDKSIEIRVFVSLLSALMGGRTNHDVFGNARLTYISVETDGMMEGLDVLRICEDGMSMSGLNILEKDFEDLSEGSALVHQALTTGFPAPSGCLSCPEFAVCGGGYPPHRYSRARQFDNPSAWCEDIQQLLGHMRESLAERGYVC